LFINASKEYEQHPDVRKLNWLSETHIERIAKAYRDFSNETNFSKVISLDDMKENDYNLNVTLYVFPDEQLEKIDVNREWDELKTIEKELIDVEEKINHFLREIQ
jgi:type I restriction enzyme M protein